MVSLLSSSVSEVLKCPPLPLYYLHKIKQDDISCETRSKCVCQLSIGEVLQSPPISVLPPVDYLVKVMVCLSSASVGEVLNRPPVSTQH